MIPAACPFCAIIGDHESSARIVYREADSTAFFPLNPASRGHTLVVPNRHVAEHTDLTDHEARVIGAAVRRTAAALRSALSPDGINIVQSTGEAATQTVPHVHFHVVPRWSGDHKLLDWPDHAAEDETSQDLTLAAVRGVMPRVEVEIADEDRRQHLSFIQAVITRMSQASSSAKTWLLPIATLTYGYALTKQNAMVAIAGVVATLVFGVLDANYLKQERAFRRLYDEVASGGDVPRFAMNPALAGPAGTSVNYWPDKEDFRSWAVAPVYVPLIIAGLAVAGWAAFR